MHGTPASLLVVEDDVDSRLLLTRRLQRQGYCVQSAEDGPQALQLIEAQRFDLVLLDIVLPGMSGFEVLCGIRKRRSINELPVIIVTAIHQTHETVRAFELGANDYLTKPIDSRVMLARVATQLSLKQLTEAHNEFLGIASHDLKKPLALIVDMVETLQEDYPKGALVTEDLHSVLSMIGEAGGYMQTIVSDYLDVSAIESGLVRLQRRSLDLNGLARQVIGANRDYAREKGQTLRLELQPELPVVQVDETRLRQVMENLIGNAVKFSPRGAVTTVCTYSDAEGVVFRVQDTGPGLGDEDLEKIFVVKCASLGNRPTGGEKSTGLGLSICKRIIDLHGGGIGVHNNVPPPGATFWFRLPAAG